jgi:DNA-binding response OmpR family regulator
MITEAASGTTTQRSAVHLMAQLLKILSLLLLVTSVSVAYGQDAPDAEAAAEPAPSDVAATEPTSTIPAVQAILETKPATTAELFRAVEIVTDLGDLPVAKHLLAKLLAANPSETELADLWERLGTARFVRLKGIPELNPEATQLADKVHTAAEQRAIDPARLAKLVEQLQSPEPDEQRAAIELLRTGRGEAVNALLKVLADPAQQAQHAGARRAIVALGDDAFGPLVAALDAKDSAFVAQVVPTLAALPREDVTWYLFAPALAADSPIEVSGPALAAVTKKLGHTPSVTEAAAILFNRAQAYYDRRVLLGQSELAPVDVWTWDAAAGQAVKNQHSPRDAGLHFATRLARDARRLAPQEATIQTLYLGARLEAEQSKLGADKSLPDGEGSALAELKQAGAANVNALLTESLRNGHAAAAANAVRALGDLSDASVLQGANGRPSPLVEALKSDDRRVRFMALRSILKLNPQEAFAGSSYVTKALQSFLLTAGEPRAIVAGPSLREDQRLAGLLLESGYAADSVDVYGDVQRALFADSDVELVLLDIRFAAQTSGELLAKLRRDARGAKLPIGIVYSPYDRANPAPLDNAGGIIVMPDDQQLAEALARRFARVQPIMRPQEASELMTQLNWLLEKQTTTAVPKEERLTQAKFALAWVRRLAEQKSKLFQVAQLEPAVRALLPFEAYTEDAAATLVALGTASGQRDLVHLASIETLPLPQRELAAKAFAASVANHGILLTTDEMELQYERYNASATADEATQKLLGGILDALEGASANGVRARE